VWGGGRSVGAMRMQQQQPLRRGEHMGPCGVKGQRVADGRGGWGGGRGGKGVGGRAGEGVGQATHLVVRSWRRMLIHSPSSRSSWRPMAFLASGLLRESTEMPSCCSASGSTTTCGRACARACVCRGGGGVEEGGGGEGWVGGVEGCAPQCSRGWPSSRGLGAQGCWDGEGGQGAAFGYRGSAARAHLQLVGAAVAAAGEQQPGPGAAAAAAAAAGLQRPADCRGGLGVARAPARGQRCREEEERHLPLGCLLIGSAGSAGVG
jgi:hypothetical protein